MQHRAERALVAKVGAFVFAGVLGLPASLPASGAQVSLSAPAATGSQAAIVAVPFTSGELPLLRDEVRAVVIARAASEADALAEDPGLARAQSAPVAPPPAPVAVAAPAPVVVTAPAPGGSIVLASWYGPGFYGNRTACGLTYTPEVLGVAHLTLPCGSLVTLTSPAGRTLTVPVIDRGPYVAGRTLDLSNATRLALACSDLCSVRMSIP